LTIDLGEDLQISLGDQVDINVVSSKDEGEIDFFEWSTEEFLNCNDCFFQTIEPLTSILYRLKVTDENGCTAEDDVVISVVSGVKIDLPNVFKPSSQNGNNRYYLPQTLGIRNINFLSIYDRWGNQMYHKKDFMPGDPADGWDGNFLGEAVRPQVFAVIGEVVLISGEVVLIEQDMTLIR